MQEYKLILKNEKVSKYNIIAWVFAVFNLAAIVFLVLSKKDISTLKFIFIISLPLIVIFLHYLYQKKHEHKRINSFEFPLLLMMLPWLMLKIYWVAAAVFLFSFFHGLAIRILSVSVSSNKIVYPSFPKKSFSWYELKNVILKDGLLTIDLKNNTLIQQPIEPEFTAVNEKEFNEFCHERLQTAVST